MTRMNKTKIVDLNAKGIGIQVTLSVDVMKALAHMAIDRNLTKSELACKLIEEGLKKQ